MYSEGLIGGSSRREKLTLGRHLHEMGDAILAGLGKKSKPLRERGQERPIFWEMEGENSCAIKRDQEGSFTTSRGGRVSGE